MEKITNEEKGLLILKDKVELVINTTERPCSYEFGKAGARHKLYYDDAEDLRKQLDKLVTLGFAKEEDFKSV